MLIDVDSISQASQLFRAIKAPHLCITSHLSLFSIEEIKLSTILIFKSNFCKNENNCFICGYKLWLYIVYSAGPIL